MAPHRHPSRSTRGKMRTKSLKLLVVEDNEDDERLILRALARADRPIEVEVIRDGEAAVKRLCASLDSPLPDMVLLDWKLNKVMGADVLRAIRQSERCKELSVVAFSSSDNVEDWTECMALRGNAFVTKPVEYYKFLTAVEAILLEHAPKVSSQRNDDRFPSQRVQGTVGERIGGSSPLEPDGGRLNRIAA
jgi:CheY-like chemotaxis protein